MKNANGRQLSAQLNKGGSLMTYYCYGYELPFGEFNHLGGSGDLRDCVRRAIIECGSLAGVVIIRVDVLPDGTEKRREI